ncbi:uncharacterized protein F5147DRAFT_772022 [Suillus discolor]|uniref:Uncharacterized protein n=1 Tax=Suillus discolor TaxID=1912936 RepID=A0A9P7FAV3_9AGAM|nr:uncharacterized protein F5147DRAFT_772022 [Suillus discolor]KAG2111302.1 hypothetical protein F5147DRAFT_772022 [Suillus discolor]
MPINEPQLLLNCFAMPQSNSSVDSPKKTKQKKLTEEEVLVLKSHLEEWKEAAAKDRKKILKAVIKEAKVHAPAMDDRLLKKRKLVYRDWLYNRRPEKTRKKKDSKFGQKWTSRSVIEQQRKEEIIEKTGAMPGSKKFIERYQTTLTAVMASLSKEQLEEAQKTAIKWSDKAPPAGVQADFAKKKAPGMMKDLATKLWKQAGMRIFILSAWKAEEGEVRINGIDFNKKLEGNSFTDTKDWKPMLSEWNAYAREEFEVDLNDDDDNDDEGEVKKSRKKGRKKEDYPLEVDTYGLPVILDAEDLNLEGKKHLIRTFLTRHYRLCSQQTKASVPWSSVRMAQGDFIEAKFLPTGCQLDDPSKIRLVDADRLLELWRQRQKDQVRPTFEFKAWEGDDKMMREPVEMISGNDSDIRPRVPVKKSTGKRSRRMEQELSSEDDDNDDDNDKEDREEDKEEGGGKHRRAHTVPSDSEQEDPPPPVKKPMPVPKPKPTKMHHHASPVPSDSDNEDPPPPVKKPVPVPKPTKKRGRVDPIQTDSESDRQPLVKKSKLAASRRGPSEDNTGTGAVQSTGNHINDPLPASKSHEFGPISGMQTRKNKNKPLAPKPTPPSPRKSTRRKTKGPEPKITNPEPKRSLRSKKASYKANYMHK